MEEPEETLSPRDEKIFSTYLEYAVRRTDDKNGEGWSETRQDELCHIVQGMYIKTWLPIDTMPDSSECMPVVIWWCDNWVMVNYKDGEWVTELDEYPFHDVEDKPTHWCSLPVPPLEAITRILEEHRAKLVPRQT